MRKNRIAKPATLKISCKMEKELVFYLEINKNYFKALLIKIYLKKMNKMRKQMKKKKNYYAKSAFLKKPIIFSKVVDTWYAVKVALKI